MERRYSQAEPGGAHESQTQVLGGAQLTPPVQKPPEQVSRPHARSQGLPLGLTVLAGQVPLVPVQTSCGSQSLPGLHTIPAEAKRSLGQAVESVNPQVSSTSHTLTAGRQTVLGG